MASVVITGANRGLGLEFARQYAEAGWRVFACCRDPESAEALKALPGDVRVLALDVTDKAEIAALAAFLDGVPVDLLINNAGVYGPKPGGLGDVTVDAWEKVMKANVYAPLRISRALLNNVSAAKGTIAAMSSAMGSMAENVAGGSYIYRSSKAALNAAMKSLAIDAAPMGVSVVLLHPGWARTDMGGAGAPVDPVEAVTGLRAVIANTSLATSGRLMEYTGREIPW